jgi:hypothetical protein
MRSKFRGIAVACCLLFLSALPAYAHHAFEAEFSDQKPITITGVITKVDWVNPHTYLYIDVKDASGKVVNWSFESMPPGMLHKLGMTKDMLPIGQTVTVSGYGPKDESKSLGWVKVIHFADGRTIQMTANNPNETIK